MSFADFASRPGQMDLEALIKIHTTVAAASAPFASPWWNLPIFLFGYAAYDRTESNDPLRLFLPILVFSIPLDLIFFYNTRSPRNIGGWLLWIIYVNNMGLKFVTMRATVASLSRRGAEPGRIGGWVDAATGQFRGGGFGSGGQGAFMPGGYQDVPDLEDQVHAPPAVPAGPAPPFQSAPPAAATVATHTPAPPAHPAPSGVTGGYHTLE